MSPNRRFPRRTRHVIVEAKGVFTRNEAREYGYDDKAVTAALRAKLWYRLRRGMYTFRDVWAVAGPEERHRIMARAVIRSLGGKVALSHTSAALEHGLLTYGVDLSRVHVTRLDGGAGRTEAGVVHHEGLCLGDDVVEKDGLLLTKPARAALEAASTTTIPSGLVTVDSVLHLGLADPAEIDARAAVMQHWPGTQCLTIVIRMADGRAESVGETLGRHLYWVTGLPAPLLQFEVYDADGVLVGVTDFAWPEHHLLGEFDGMVKYQRLLKPGETPYDAVAREKRREDLLREITRRAMIRLIWVDLFRQQQTAARTRRLMSIAA